MLGGQHDTLPKPRNINGPPKEPSSHLHASACTCMLVRIHITTTSALHLAQGGLHQLCREPAVPGLCDRPA
eukprot:scaffold147996_cov22-Tisochrysis_lutea.AAC.3